MDADEEDFVFYGTPIEREEEITSRKKKAVAEASGQLRTLAPWKQEVTDEEGRRRFHGAFTGGFSAGYYNTVGSKEGWTPQSFTSSRKSRAEVKKQSISDFLDEDEKAEFEGQSLGTTSRFDTFGFTAAEHARRQAEKEQHQRPSAIPGPAPDELVLPVTESIGVKLLLKMGWRRGHSVKDLRATSDARREARRAFLAFSANDTNQKTANSESFESELEMSVMPPVDDDIRFSQSTPAYVVNPKQDLHGLGYDPFKHAPEFRERKRSRISASKELSRRKPLSLRESLFGSKSGKVAPGFGIGALEELDVEDEDVYSGYDFEETYVEEDVEPSRISRDDKPKLLGKEQHGVLHGFRVSSEADYKLERFEPPEIPKDFVPQHRFPGPLESGNNFAVAAPSEVPPPDDNNLKLLIEGVATLVARSGKLFEDLSREKNQSNPLFGFLNGGKGHDYYERKLWEERQKRKDSNKLFLDGKTSPRVQKMTAETRGKILGERTLEKSSSASSGVAVQFPVNLSDTFTKPASFNEALEAAKPFKDDPAKQERFEQFLKEKYLGGLRSTDFNKTNNMSEEARARERLDFEAAADAIAKGKTYNEDKPPTQPAIDFLAAGAVQFTSSGQEKAKDAEAEDMSSKKPYPIREEFHWRPSPLLCKRYDLLDPCMGKPPPAPRSKSKMDSLIFMPDSVKATGLQETVNSSFVPQPSSQETNKVVSDNDTITEVEVENVERPVDLYKAIFSDDSEDEVEASNNIMKAEDQGKKSEAAASTLNRLIAGDFLESLGKELGLEVPPEVTYPEKKPIRQKEPLEADPRNSKAQPIESKSSNQERESQGNAHAPVLGNLLSGSGEFKEEGRFACISDKVEPEGHTQDASKDGRPSRIHRNLGDASSFEDDKSRSRREKSPSRQGRWNSSESSGDERRRKKSKRNRNASNDSNSDSSDDYRDHHGSRSKGKNKDSSRERRRSSKKHSRHRKHKSKNSSLKYSSDEERKESRREKRKLRD